MKSNYDAASDWHFLPNSNLARLSMAKLLTVLSDSWRDWGLWSLNALPEATLVCDTTGLVLQANRAAADFFEVSHQRMLRGLTAQELCKGMILGGPSSADLADYFSSITPHAVQLEARHAGHDDLLVDLAPRLSGCGHHEGWTLMVLDISRFHQVARERDEALRFISHDLRAPISSILAIVEMWRMQPEIFGASDVQLRLLQHASCALALSDDFLHLSQAQNCELHFENVLLAELMDEVVDSAWEQAQLAHVTVSLTSNCPEAFWLADRTLLKRALGNLVSNAIKFTPAHGNVHCSIDQDHRGWMIRVIDEGPGISSGQLEHLCDPFVRLHEHTHPEIAGVGLGLAFVKTVLQRHSATLTVQSRPGQGATFCVGMYSMPRENE